MNALLTFLLLLCPFVHAEMNHGQFIRSVEPTGERLTHVRVEASDGFRLHYVRFRQYYENEKPRPLLILPGRGESYFDYLELVQLLLDHGQGPIYILEPRGQGFSGRDPFHSFRTSHVDSFDRYVEDVIEWMDSLPPESSQSMNVIGYSMGGAIANLALLKRPELFQRVAYLAPMFDINLPKGFLSRHKDLVMGPLLNLLCLVNRCFSTIELHNRDLSKGYARPVSQEKAKNQFVELKSISPQWLREAYRATKEVRREAHRQSVPSLVIAGTRDPVVNSEVFEQYVCDAKNCELKFVDWSHGVHHSADGIYHQVLSMLIKFLNAETNCEAELH